ncbi:THAP domain-containing protein 2-like [Protopterus annectens]|uniref:THAP domain-containing protein 2-like n=1 Tax=Protopterus annectens TaxID=7888 RepID=UPI001CFC0ACB|nr:THAP domain-containing protein 2-like [Protopterus annectens]
MPVSCAAYGCNSRNTLESRQQGVTFHRFPLSNKPLLQEWRLAMKRSKHNGELWMPSPYQRICSLHFEKQSFDETGQTRRLRSNAVPSIFNFPDHFEKLHRKQKGRKRKYVREDSDYDVCNGAEEVGEDGGGIAVDGGNNEDDEDDVVLPSVSKDVLQNPHLVYIYI